MATDWERWRAELASLHQDALPKAQVRSRLLILQKRLPADPPYAVQRESARVGIRLAESDQQLRDRYEALRVLALRNGDRDTAQWVQVKEIFDSHADDNIEIGLQALDALRLQSESASVELRSELELSYGYMYWDVGNFELALRNLMAARALAPQLPGNDPERMLTRNENIARLYVDMQDASSALAELEHLASDLPNEISPRMRGNLAATRGAAQRLGGRPLLAVEILSAALAETPPRDTGNATQRIRQELVEAYLALRQPERALPVARQMVGAGEAGSQYYAAEGQILRGAAEAGVGQIEQGLESIRSGLAYYRKARLWHAVQRGLGRKVDALQAVGRTDEALAALRERYALSMMLYDANRAQGVARLQVEEDLARREEEIRRLSADNVLQQTRLQAQRYRNWAWTGLGVLGAGLIVTLALLLRSTRRQREALWKDALTGAFTRHYLDHWLANKGLRARTRRALVLMDLDFFKAINDRYGHAGGDEVLQFAGARLRSGIQGQGELFRWGGEEFLLIQDLPEDTDVEAWLAALLRLSQAEAPWGQQRIPISASMGCIVLEAADMQADTFDLAVHVADLGLYMAKANGRARATYLQFTDAGGDAWQAQPPVDQDELRAWQQRGWVRLSTVLAHVDAAPPLALLA